MKLSVPAVLSAVLFSTASNAQVPCSVYSGSWPSNAAAAPYSKVLDSFWHASFETTKATLDPVTRHFEITNKSARRRVVCHYYRGQICFWINAGHTCITTLATNFINPSNPGIVYHWIA
ncbi:hypothetical protein CH063_11604 [Colletotrichum higginsianum]|uniref:Uncharacterized protein n=1 Tax=Colletotrichum higginsianum (strain IMI 349063) TaxID=759273 RepID=H1VM21_COLHI|nr:hypothetical protein CH63R_03729 [Colletotrichum higginsianum IMI 349063]OBR11433.1 hypothetical protein CH63R_03729 [Colletotrichum higginsianum IMI 349063]CCF41274.1 hypothetical protein CH063_11604 [Colletotrichum higginsianum]